MRSLKHLDLRSKSSNRSSLCHLCLKSFAPVDRARDLKCQSTARPPRPLAAQPQRQGNDLRGKRPATRHIKIGAAKARGSTGTLRNPRQSRWSRQQATGSSPPVHTALAERRFFSSPSRAPSPSSLARLANPTPSPQDVILKFCSRSSRAAANTKIRCRYVKRQPGRIRAACAMILSVRQRNPRDHVRANAAIGEPLESKKLRTPRSNARARYLPCIERGCGHEARPARDPCGSAAPTVRCRKQRTDQTSVTSIGSIELARSRLDRPFHRRGRRQQFGPQLELDALQIEPHNCLRIRSVSTISTRAAFSAPICEFLRVTRSGRRIQDASAVPAESRMKDATAVAPVLNFQHGPVFFSFYAQHVAAFAQGEKKSSICYRIFR